MCVSGVGSGVRLALVAWFEVQGLPMGHGLGVRISRLPSQFVLFRPGPYAHFSKEEGVSQRCGET